MKKGFLTTLFLLLMLLPLQSSAACSHNWTEWETYYEATCDETGEMYRYCTICDEEEYKEIPATGNHTMSDWIVGESATCGDAGYMYRECTVCYGEYEEKEIPATGNHTWEAWETVEEPDCMNKGSAIRYCKVCDEYETKTLKKDPSAHSYGRWTVTKKATLLSTGKKERECYVCGKVQTKKIAKLKEDTATTSAEKKAVKVVDNLFTYAKDYNTKKMKSCFKTPDNAKFLVDSRLQKLMKKYNTKYLKYAVKSIKVSGKTATIKVYCQYMDYINAYWQAYWNLYDYSDVYTVSEETNSERLVVQTVKCIKKMSGTKTTKTITIKLQKSSGKWKITTTSTALLDALNMGYATYANEMS